MTEIIDTIIQAIIAGPGPCSQKLIHSVALLFGFSSKGQEITAKNIWKSCIPIVFTVVQNILKFFLIPVGEIIAMKNLNKKHTLSKTNINLIICTYVGTISEDMRASFIVAYPHI